MPSVIKRATRTASTGPTSVRKSIAKAMGDTGQLTAADMATLRRRMPKAVKAKRVGDRGNISEADKRTMLRKVKK